MRTEGWTQALVIISLVVQAVVLAIVCFTLFIRLDTTPSDVYGRLEMIETKLDLIVLKTRDRWMRSDQELWEQKFKAANPGVKLPNETGQRNNPPKLKGN